MMWLVSHPMRSSRPPISWWPRTATQTSNHQEGSFVVLRVLYSRGQWSACSASHALTYRWKEDVRRTPRALRTCGRILPREPRITAHMSGKSTPDMRRVDAIPWATAATETNHPPPGRVRLSETHTTRQSAPMGKAEGTPRWYRRLCKKYGGHPREDSRT
jgi:hypothetical protein